MSKKTLPKLRFRNFTTHPKWNIANLGDLSVPVTEKVAEKRLTLMSVTSGVGLVPQVEKFGREIAGNSYKNYYAIKKYDFAYNKSATKQFPEGYISMLNDYEEAALPNSIFTCFRITDEECCPEFFNQLFQNNHHGTWLRKYIEVGARAHGSLSIDNKYLWSMPIALPKKAEQQKISDCLLSLDELIEAERKKQETLQKHKKGLMQKLFPAEGKSVPEWRFPEFKDSGKWNKIKIGEVGEVITGKTPNTSDKTLWNGNIQFVTPTDITDNKYQIKTERNVEDNIKGRILPPHSIMFTCIASIGKMSISVYPCITNQQINSIIPHDLYCNEYVYYTLLRKSVEIKKSISNTTLPIINKSEFSDILLDFPENIKEQQKIADCLSQIDNFILSQSQKIDKLKEHKKGLMQGLFPSIEEVCK